MIKIIGNSFGNSVIHFSSYQDRSIFMIVAVRPIVQYNPYMIFKMASSLTLLLILFCLISQVSLSTPDRPQGREKAMSSRMGEGKQK